MSDSNATTRCFACMAGCGDRHLERGPAPAGLLPSAVWLFGLPLLALSCAVVAADWYALARPAVAQEAREAHRTWYTEAWRREAAALIRGRLAPVASFLDGLATFDQREELAALDGGDGPREQEHAP